MGLRGKLRYSFITGLVLVLPLVITVYILYVLSGFALQVLDPIVEGTDLESYTANVGIAARVVAAAFLVLLITLLGALAQRESGQRLFGEIGRSVSLIPVVRTIYSTVRQISTSVTGVETSYDTLVLVEFPRKGVYSIGLVTGESPEAVEEVARANVYNVFLPSSPNPAGGRLVLVPEEQLHEVDLSVRQGLGLLMTTGARPNQADGATPAGTVSPEAAVQSIASNGEFDESPGGKEPVDESDEAFTRDEQP